MDDDDVLDIYRGLALAPEAEFQAGNQRRAEEVLLLLLPIRQRPKMASLIRQFRMKFDSDFIQSVSL